MHFWVRFMRIGLIAIVAVVLQAGVVSEASLVPLDDSLIRDLRSGCYRYMIETASIGRGFVVSRPADEIQIHELRVPFARSPVPEKFKAAPIAKNGKYMVAAGEKSTLLTVNRGEHGGAIWEKSETGIAPVLQSMVPMNGICASLDGDSFAIISGLSHLLTENGEIFVLSKSPLGTWSIRTIKAWTDRTPIAMHCGERENLLLFADGGVEAQMGEQLRTVLRPGLFAGSPSSIAQDAQGTIYIAGWPVLAKFDRSRNQLSHFVSREFVPETVSKRCRKIISEEML